MGNPWDAERSITAREVHAEVGGRWPELAALPPSRIGSGWDVDVWRVGELAFRFPRRAFGAKALRIERRALPFLGRALRGVIAIPEPSHLGPDDDAFPSPFYGHPYLPGTPADRVSLGEVERAALAPDIARVLRALHALDPQEALAAGLQVNDWRADVNRHQARGLHNLSLLCERRYQPLLGRARAIVERLPPPAAPSEQRVIHGDFYVRHLLLDEGLGLTGVIDWGDTGIGDRAVDLAVVYNFLPPAARDAFWATYGPVDEGTLTRARFIAVCCYGLHLVRYAADIGDPALLRECDLGLRYAVE